MTDEARPRTGWALISRKQSDPRQPRTEAGRELMRSFQSPDERFTNEVVRIGILAIEAEAAIPDSRLRAEFEKRIRFLPGRDEIEAGSGHITSYVETTYARVMDAFDRAARAALAPKGRQEPPR